MKAVETIAISTNGTLTVQVPTDLPAGKHRVVLVIDEGDSREPVIPESTGSFPIGPLGLHLYPYDLPEELGTLRREDLYGEDGR